MEGLYIERAMESLARCPLRAIDAFGLGLSIQRHLVALEATTEAARALIGPYSLLASAKEEWISTTGIDDA